MKRMLYTALASLGLLSAVSCIEEDLAVCPSGGGGVTVALCVEKFRTRPPYQLSDLEETFGTRIHSMQYLLYAEGRLIEQGSIAGIQSVEGGSCLFRHDTLPFGAYRLAFIANTSASSMAGTADAPETYYITYQGTGREDDHFRADLSFEITCPYRNEFETVLQRVYGVTRFRFEQVPAEITSIEVSLDNVGERIPVCGEPDRSCKVAKRISTEELASRAGGTYTLGTFSTLPGMKSSWRMKLYAGDETAPVYDRLITDTLRIERNQLIDLKARFKEEDFRNGIEFLVDVNSSWDGSNEGGGEVMN